MKNIITTFRNLLLIFILLFIASCQRPLFDEEIEDIAKGNIPLKVSTRSGGNAQMEYPAYIYAFDSNKGTCVAFQKMTDENAPVELSLPPAKYMVVALAGMGEDYVLPENPCLTDVIGMKSTNNRSECALMMGRATVSVTEKSEMSITLTLYHAVSVVNVSLQDIPSSVTSVRFLLSPLYSALSFNGEYTGEGVETEVDCFRNSDANWCTDPFYIFPGSDTQTLFSIILLEDGKSENYSYTYTKGGPEANTPFNIIGSYSGGIMVSGNLVAGDWEAPVDVIFDFGLQTGDDDDDDTQMPDNLPEIGQVWDDGIVADITYIDSEEVNFLLLSLEEWTSLASNASALVADAVADGWRFPTDIEAENLRDELGGDNLTAVNKHIAEAGSGYAKISTDYRYLCNKGGYFYAYGFKTSSTVLQAGSTVKYKIRLVRQVHLMFEK